MKHRRRALEAGAEGEFTAEELHDRLLEQGGRCAYCGTSIVEGATVDHMAPLSREGSNAIANIALCCGPCNSGKGAQTLVEFAGKKLQGMFT